MDSRWNMERMNSPRALMHSGDSHDTHGHDSDELNSARRFEPYKRVHRLMRGRYHLLLPSLAIALLVGGIYGWRRATPDYRAEGLIQVADKLPVVVESTDQTQISMFEEFVQSQVLVMSSRSVVSLAMYDPKFREALGTRHDITVETFVGKLLVEHPPRTQAIDVTFIDSDPNVAAHAVQALIEAFLKVSGKNGNVDDDRRLQVLESRVAQLNSQIDDVKKTVSQIKPPSVLSIAMVDEMMRSLLSEQTALKNQLDAAQAAGYADGRALVINTKIRIDDVNNRIEGYRKDFTAMQAATVTSPQADRRVAMLPEFLGYQEKVDAMRSEHDEVLRRLNTLRTEASLGAERFRILTNGETPAAPYADRRPRLAAIYGLGLSILPLTVFFVLGLIDRRFRFSEDATDGHYQAPLLGVLPELPAAEGYGDLAKIAAYCVHNLRIRLQLLSVEKKQRVYMITSSAAGEGKTSVTLALGLSFAAAGRRVLLIDADTVGRGLTYRLRAEDKPGLIESVSGEGIKPAHQVMKNIWLLPTGQTDEVGVGGSLPLEGTAEVIEAARGQFDLVLVDTGPVLASLQMPIVAQLVDHVIMTVSQGLQQAMYHRSMQILRSMGIKVCGVVFNRACPSDYRRWIGGDSYEASSSSANWRQPTANGSRLSEYGPLAESMTTPDRMSLSRTEP